MRIALLTTAITSLLVAGCSSQPSAAPEHPLTPASVPIATTRQIMLAVVIPASDIVWSTATGAPADDAAWEKIQANAVMLAEAGHLLLTRAVDQGEWNIQTKALIDSATAAAQAAADKNLDKLNEAGNNMYDACDRCHQKYMPARQGEAK